MKKFSLSIFAICFCLSLLTTSCTKTCHGGGWYGNRNLSSIEMKKPVKKEITTQKSTQKELETTEENERTALSK